MTVLPLVFAVIAATGVVMVGLVLVFRGFLRLREEHAPELVHARLAAEPAGPAANPAKPRPKGSHSLAA